ncbi:MAG: SUMF1/EgtB/PvdO family nonheme iron enzyme [Candidatus Latescibacterota bacterium]
MARPRALRWAIRLLPGILLVACQPAPVRQGRDGARMLLIRGGEFQMGGRLEELAGLGHLRGHLNYEAERPLHRVKLSHFYLDEYEVTNALYHRFLAAVDSSGSRDFDHPQQPAGLSHQQQYATEEMQGDEQPAVGVNWYDAYAYCAWAGKRLPTEAEWEYAARGRDGTYRSYPWGNEAPGADGIWRANHTPQGGAGLDGFGYAAPVGSFPDGVSPFGIHDLAGNAEEWVQDWWSGSYYQRTAGARDPRGPEEGQQRVIKGGSYGSDAVHIRTATRLYGPPEAKTELQGFRCAQDP